MKVLLVDDEDNLRMFLAVVLKSGGCEVLEASNGINALAVTEKHPIDVLVTNVVMSEMDGLTLAHTLLSRNPNLPVVFISGYMMDFEAEQKQIARCAFLAKPFSGKTLLNTVQGLYDGDRLINGVMSAITIPPSSRRDPSSTIH
jgi:two-component system, cell cycle sensor histidine kinase and response regulator CckA